MRERRGRERRGVERRGVDRGFFVHLMALGFGTRSAIVLNWYVMEKSKSVVWKSPTNGM